MKASVKQRELLDPLTKAVGITSQRSPLPHASRVLLTGKDGVVKLSAANESMSLLAEIPADISSPGMLCIGAKDLLDRVKALPDDVVTVASKGDDGALLTSKGSKLKFTVRVVDPADYPAVRLPRGDVSWANLDGHGLAALINGVRFSVNPDTTRMRLHVMLLELTGEKARTVSTDGHRLSRVEIACDQRATTALLPQPSLGEILKLCDAETVDFAADGITAFFRVGGITLGIRTPDTNFPPYQQVIPQPREHVVIVNREQLVRSIRAVALAGHSIEDKQYSGVKLRVEDETMYLAAESADAGDSSDELPIVYSGPKFKFGASARYMLDWLTSVDDESVELSAVGELDPVTFAAGSSIGVVMPARL